MSISSLVLELWQFSFIKDLTRNPEFANTPVLVLYNIWRLGQIENMKFGTISVIKCYWMLQNARIRAFTVSELLRENHQGGKIPPIQIRVKWETELIDEENQGILSQIRALFPVSKNRQPRLHPFPATCASAMLFSFVFKYKYKLG